MLKEPVSDSLDPNLTDDSHQSACYRAILNNDLEVVTLMLAESQVIIGLDDTALQLAIENDNASMLDLLLDYQDRHHGLVAPNEHLLQLAVEQGKVSIALLLLQHMAKPHSSLAIAVRNSDIDMIRLLLRYGACDQQFLQPLDSAMYPHDVVEVLTAWQHFYNAVQIILPVAHKKFIETDKNMTQADRIPESERVYTGWKSFLFITRYQNLVIESQACRTQGDRALTTFFSLIEEAHKLEPDLTEELLLHLITGWHAQHSQLFCIENTSEAFFKLCEHFVTQRQMFKTESNLRILLDGLGTKGDDQALAPYILHILQQQHPVDGHTIERYFIESLKFPNPIDPHTTTNPLLAQ